MTRGRDDVAAVVEKLVARWAAGDASGVARLFCRGFRWWAARVPGAPWPAQVRNHRELESFFLGYLSAFDLTRITTRGLVVEHASGVLLGRVHARVPRTGGELVYDFALWIGVRDGLICEFRFFHDTLAIARALDPQSRLP
ncbi:nuclear transport factor 2 family protein [Saccharothrix coeruleofusca]|uniref:SnoaL-like domain-containing protein n=1 Tax=Saccharothrix coeruleofusca TaxID=33919 RepID=A0A918AL77_9PSEU|nr:nuclear transport factor 2 family protein [Saccharothrix coeruleofusca]MBP2336566.1 ketosteroid isomerase-like protein [Saccharothrix coeruleofusca]GGP52103.1 hypothetical protein GCM10010185_25220 [Saccharothrix coeruleofusca]